MRNDSRSYLPTPLARIACLLLATWSASVAAQQAEPVSLSAFVDRQSSEVHISGRSIVGAAVAANQPPVLTPELNIPLAAGDNPPEICVESTTVDGSYWSRGQIDGEALASAHGVLRFRYGDKRYPAGEANYRAAADRFRADGLAVLASVGACGSEGLRNRFVVVNRTGRSDVGASAITLFVNTARSDADLSYMTRDGTRARVRCLPLQTTFQRIAYDATCTLTGPFGSVTQAQLVLSRYGDPQGILDFSLLFAIPLSHP